MRDQHLMMSKNSLFSPLPMLTELADGLGLGDALFGDPKIRPRMKVGSSALLTFGLNQTAVTQQIKLT